jgi:hypothetical protein
MSYEPHDKATSYANQNHTDYTIEVCPNNRAGCQVKECKDSGTKITKGELRYATQVTIKDHVSWQYRHWYVLVLLVYLQYVY